MFLYQTNNKTDFFKKLEQFLKIKNSDLLKKCNKSKKVIKEFSIEKHVKNLTTLLKMSK